MKSHIAFITLLFIAASCSRKKPEEAHALRPVRYETVSAGEIAGQRTYTGVAVAGTESKLSFRVSGSVISLPVKVGQSVRQGQLIAVIDASDYQLMYEEADAGVKAADAAEKNAGSNFDRISRLYENENVSLSDYEAAKAAYQSAKANEKAAKQRRKLADAQLSYTRLYAAFNGVIADVIIEENENVQAGQPVVILNSSDEIEIEVSLPDFFISEVEEGDHVYVHISSVAGKAFHGTISEVAYASTYETTYTVNVKVDDPGHEIRPGMTASVTFEDPKGVGHEGIHVPAHSVSEDRNGRFVYLVRDSMGVGVIKRQPVEVGDLTDAGIAVTSGLNPGDKVVTAGVTKITDGMLVRLPN